MYEPVLNHIKIHLHFPNQNPPLQETGSINSFPEAEREEAHLLKHDRYTVYFLLL